MGLSFSRSVRFGPVRFNFSGSGIGVSAGIKGLRIGTGPRGAYISAGAGGFRYRTSLGARRTTPATRAPAYSPPASAPVPGTEQHVLSTEHHDTLSVLDLSDSNSDSLLVSMNEQAKKQEWWPFVAGGLFILLFMAGPHVPNWLWWGLALVSVCGTLWLRHFEKLQRLTVLFFEPDAVASDAFGTLLSSLQKAASVHKLRSVTETSRLSNQKYQAGASRALTFGKATVSIGQAQGVLANIDVPLLTTGRTTFAFYPDRVLAFQGKAVGAISYLDLRATSSSSRFVEEESLPRDATVVDHTWQYVNKNGGPDKRFKNNRQFPICSYNLLHLSSSRGLDVRFQASRAGAFDELASALRSMERLALGN